jgi:hypothetical protein
MAVSGFTIEINGGCQIQFTVKPDLRIVKCMISAHRTAGLLINRQYNDLNETAN